MINNLQTILNTWNDLDDSWILKASTDDLILVALNALNITGDRATAVIESIGEAYYEASCAGATEEALAAMILASVN